MCASFFVYSSVAEKKNIAFLLGAGFSQAVDMDGTGAITSRLTDGKSKIPTECEETLIILLKVFGKWYENEFKDDWLKGLKPNYEDIYFICEQLKRALEGKQFDPLVIPGLESVLEGHRTRDPALWARTDTRADVTRRRKELQDFIRKTVFESLRNTPTNLDQLNVLEEAFRDERFELNVFSLNHDLVLEKYLNSIEVPFCDGFQKNSDGISVWNRHSYANGSKTIRLFKLHGGVNWHREASAMHYPQIFIPNDASELEYKWNEYDYPEFLIGTYNKYFEYTQGVFLDMFHLLYAFLERSDSLIAIGYGFGDIGVNNIIAKWWWERRDNQITRTIQILGDEAREQADSFNKEYFSEEYSKIVDFAREANMEIQGFPDTSVCLCKLENAVWDTNGLRFLPLQ